MKRTLSLAASSGETEAASQFPSGIELWFMNGTASFQVDCWPAWCCQQEVRILSEWIEAYFDQEGNYYLLTLRIIT